MNCQTTQALKGEKTSLARTDVPRGRKQPSKGIVRRYGIHASASLEMRIRHGRYDFYLLTKPMLHEISRFISGGVSFSLLLSGSCSRERAEYIVVVLVFCSLPYPSYQARYIVYEVMYWRHWEIRCIEWTGSFLGYKSE